MTAPPVYAAAAAVTPNDATDLPNGPANAIYVGGAGTLTVDMAGNGATVLFGAVPAGTTIPIKVKRVRATGTAATSIVALF